MSDQSSAVEFSYEGGAEVVWPQSGHPLDVARSFVLAKLAGFRSRRRLYVKLSFSDRRLGFVRSRLTWERGWAESSASVRWPLKVPHVEEVNVGSVQVKDPLEQALMGLKWFYEKRKVEFRGQAEVAVFGAALAAFALLRKADLIPGRRTNTEAARKAISWLEEFRGWDAAGRPEGGVRPEPRKEPRDAGDHGDPDDRGLQEAGGGEGGGDGGEGPGDSVLDQDRDEGAGLQGDGGGDQGRDGRDGLCTPRRRKTGARGPSRISFARLGTGSRS